MPTDTFINTKIDRRNSSGASIPDWTEKAPLVSVLIPLYNHEKYVADCIDSIVGQDYQNIEIVLVDDASSDHGLQVAKDKLTSCNVAHTILENAINVGICATMNRAVQAAHGKYACIIASDDLLAMGRVKRHIQILEKCTNPSIVACHGPLQVISKNGMLAGIKCNLTKRIHYELASVVTKTACPSLQGCTFKIDKLKKFPFDETLFFEDWDFFIRLFFEGYKVYSDEGVSVLYRSHENGANRRICKMIESREIIRQKHLERISDIDSALARAFEFCIRFGDLMSISYTGNLGHWISALAYTLSKHPVSTLARIRHVAWSLRNLITNRNV